MSTEPEHTTQEKIMDQSAYVLIEVSPDGSTKIHEVFEAESLALAKEYASARNETELDWYVQRFREEGPVPLVHLTRMEDGRLIAFPRDPQTQSAPTSRRKAMTTAKTETRFQSQIRSFNKMYKLDCEDSPKLPHGYQNAAKRISDFMSILQEEIEEGTAIADSLQSVAPIQEVLAQIADWLGDIQVYCASEMRKFGLDNDATLGIIMASNFSKLDEDGEPIYDERGKVLKGVNFFPPEPELRELIGHQMIEAAKQQIVE